MSFSAERSYKKKDKDHKPTPKIKFEDIPKLSPQVALEAKKPAIDRGARCTECSLFLYRAGPIMGEVRKNARLVIVGEAGGQNELEQGRPFVGKSGQILNEALIEGGIAREECTLTNASACRPPEEFKAFEHRLKITYEMECEKAVAQGKPLPVRPLTPTEACFPRLQRDIEESKHEDGKPSHILAIGNAALKVVADHYNVPFGTARKAKAGEARISSLKKTLGAPLVLNDGTTILGTYHPAFAMRPGSKHYMHVIKLHIKRAAEIAVRGYVDWKEPPYILNPTVSQVKETLEKIRASGVIVSVDIETDKGTHGDKKFDPYSCKLRCIGFGAVVDGQEILINVPIRHMSGENWWEPEDKKEVLQACMNVLNHNPLLGHNLAFDTQVLLRFGLITEANRQRPYDDTILLHRNTIDCDLPHDLGFVASRYFEVPAWKASSDDKYVENVTDDVNNLYNLRDVCSVLRLYPVLVDELYKYGTVAQYEMDKAMAPAVRDMGTLGLFVDEKKRGELCLAINKEVHERLMKIKELVGDQQFNPNSPHQIRKFLFQEKKMIPIINSKGKDWEEGEDASTNAQSLTKLVSQQGADEQTKKFINVLLEYKTLMKLKGTYLDNLRVTYPDWSKFGLVIEDVPEVRGPAWREHKPTDKAELAKERFPEEWSQATKDEKKVLAGRIEDGVWEDALILPKRPALSRLYVTYKQHVVSSARLSSTPNCFDDKTEILTKSGWKLFKDLTPDDVVAQYWWETEEIEFVKPAAYIEQDFDGELVYLSSDRIDICGTPDHRIGFFAACDGQRQTEILANWLRTDIKDRLIPSGGIYARGSKTLTNAKIDLWMINPKLEELFDFDQETLLRIRDKFAGHIDLKQIVDVLTGKNKYATADHTRTVPYKGKVYCVSVPSEMIIIRRNGRVGIPYNCQNLPKQGKVNTHEMFVCPPGHVMVGADLDQVELRLYAGISGDKLITEAFRTGMDPHSYNAASLFAKKFGKSVKETYQVIVNMPLTSGQAYLKKAIPESAFSFVSSYLSSIKIENKIDSIVAELKQKLGRASLSEDLIEKAIKEYRTGYSKGDKEKKKLRGYAKTFCIAEGQRVLTDRGLVPIEFVQLSDKLWDGTSWVSHDGVIYKGEQSVIKYDGLKATPEHKVWIETGEIVEFKIAKERGLRLARSGEDAFSPKAEGTTATNDAEKVRVYDILNAGPLRRFTVEGRLVSNCYLVCYGGSPDKLFAYMSVARDKNTGALMFPDLKESDVLEWHEQWHKFHPETIAWQEACEKAARLYGYTASPIGCCRKRFFPGGSNKPGATYNHLNQSSAAEIANSALIKITQKIPYGCWSPFTGAFLQVHDYIGCIVPDDRAEETKKIIEDALNTSAFGIPITASAVISKKLSEQ